MESVRTRKGADIASYDYLIVAKIKLKPKRHWTSEKTAVQGLKTAFFQDTDKLNGFKIPLIKRFQVSQDLPKEDESTMEDNQKKD
ncbi:unnamed protein product [Schistosoma margrebowiei]|uniref:Uncharacterized protein n=1 Tax=Schistosoma margrebowiei TaxID=48269 RepID=A0A183M029_9TREM|nr:unnamed protein product [Schistosoma margrebowiei]